MFDPISYSLAKKGLKLPNKISEIDIDVDKDWNNKSLTNVNNITANNANISTITLQKINNKLISPVKSIYMGGYLYSDTTSHTLTEGNGGVVYQTTINTEQIADYSFQKIVVETDCYVSSGGSGYIYCSIYDSSGNQIYKNGAVVTNTSTQTKKFEFLLEYTNSTTYTVKVGVIPIGTGDITFTGFRVYW